jgi:diadenosine tetraphosphatase ApaH/serine/threonine PP2A family protein phosphatase
MFVEVSSYLLTFAKYVFITMYIYIYIHIYIHTYIYIYIVGKYDEITFGMFVEVFSYLPLFAIINDAVLVVHGGIFHTQDALLSELNAIKRSDFSLRDMPDGGEKLDEVYSINLY